MTDLGLKRIVKNQSRPNAVDFLAQQSAFTAKSDAYRLC